MTVYGFVGPSGTGKSFRAIEVAKRNNVSCILDDGLLIRGNKVLAGISAKREASRIASVRRALFTEQPHAEEVRGALNAANADSVMILGTSVHMVDSIAARLFLPPISVYIDIADVASKNDIEAARAIRMDEGKHVIPVPTFALKKEFSGYFMAPLRLLAKFGKKPGKPVAVDSGSGYPGGDAQAAAIRNTGIFNAGDLSERTVVRPTFSYLGRFIISRAALEQLAARIIMKCEGVSEIAGASVDYTDSGLDIELSVCVKYGVRIHEALNYAVRLLRNEFDRQTSLHIRSVMLTAKSLDIA